MGLHFGDFCDFFQINKVVGLEKMLNTNMILWFKNDKYIVDLLCIQ